MKILVVQNNAIIGNQQATFKNVEKMLEKHTGSKPDLMVFPEVWSVGWDCSIFPEYAEFIETSKTIDFLKHIALEFNTTIIGGSFIQKKDKTLKNTCPVISKQGKLITTYDKMHLFSHKGSEENEYISTGDKLKIIDFGYTKIGLSICYDIRFPELYRKYSQNGAEVIINMAAWSNKKLNHWKIMHTSRAIENQCFLIAVDQTGKIKNDEYNLGHSMAINPWGDIIEKLDSEENCLYFELDLNEVKKIREDFPLLKDRRDLQFTGFDIEEIKINEQT